MFGGRHAALVLLVPLLAGCASDLGADSGAPGRTSAAAGPASVSSAPASAAPSVTASTDTQTLTGTVITGVEGGCLLLRDATGTYQLLFDDPALRSAVQPGTKATVVGRPDPNRMTICQQGEPFVVSAVRGN